MLNFLLQAFKQHGIPKEWALIMSNFASWESEAQKSWVIGQGHPASQG